MPNALVIGGAGATGLVIVRQLLKRDYQVTILHTGNHKPDLPEEVAHIHASPYKRDALEDALEGKHYDLIVATYGMLKHVTKAVVGKTARFISVGGLAPIYKGWGDMIARNPWETMEPTPLSLPEDHALASDETESQFSMAVRGMEGLVMQGHAAGDFNGTHFRYPLVYGPSNICPAEWGVVRRVRDQRRTLIMPGGGLTIIARGYAENIAHAIMLAVEQPENSGGQIYNIRDDRLQYNHEWVAQLCSALGHEFELIDIPFHLLPEGFRASPPQLLYRHHWHPSIDKIKEQLGYRDVVSFEDAVERTASWYMDNPLPPGDEAELNLGDPFDYEHEDGVVAVWRKLASEFGNAIADIPRKEVVWHHPYRK
ncbi:MAG: NAD-dependent epimerase/dehydratase family protein [Myxococcota bacterium]